MAIEITLTCDVSGFRKMLEQAKLNPFARRTVLGMMESGRGKELFNLRAADKNSTNTTTLILEPTPLFLAIVSTVNN